MQPAIAVALAATFLSYFVMVLSEKHCEGALKLFGYLLAFTLGMVVLEELLDLRELTL